MSRSSEVRHPFIRLVLYYATLGLAAWLVVRLLPTIPALLTRFRDAPAADALVGGVGAAPPLSQGEWALLTLVAMLTAVALVLPVAWVYMLTKRKGGYDQSVVQTVIILPMTVAGTVILVRHSLALAFALAAIVAAVRFRNTLKDTKDAVYIFLALGVGVAAGVVAPAVAAVMSVLFNIVVLLLWAFNVGNIYADRLGSERAARLAPQLDDDQERKKKRFNGAVLVQAARLAPAQQAAEALLDERTKRWKLAGVTPAAGETHMLEYLVRMKDDGRVTALIEALKDRGAPDVVHAEFRSLRGLEPRERE
jgi:hypothetical protein